MSGKSGVKWPTIQDKTIKLRHMPEIEIGATVSIDTGRPIVTHRVGDGDADAMTPTEARRVAAALVKAAECCDRKTEVARSRGAGVLTEEINA